MRCYAGLTVEAREIERVAEEVGRQSRAVARGGTETHLASGPHAGPASDTKLYVSFDGAGVPVRPSELVGRRGKQADGSARTREAKLGCVFTQVGYLGRWFAAILRRMRPTGGPFTREPGSPWIPFGSLDRRS